MLFKIWCMVYSVVYLIFTVWCVNFLYIFWRIFVYTFIAKVHIFGELRNIYKKLLLLVRGFGLFDKSFETHHDNYLPAGWVLTLSFTMFTMFTRTKWDTNFMLTLWEHFGNNSKTCSMRVILRHARWEIWIEETTKYCEVIGEYYYYHYYFIITIIIIIIAEASATLRCAPMFL